MENKVICSVSGCKYHSEGKVCTAKKIEIAPNDAHTTNETGCITFKPE